MAYIAKLIQWKKDQYGTFGIDDLKSIIRSIRMVHCVDFNSQSIDLETFMPEAKNRGQLQSFNNHKQ